jgi:hypothetical protein
MCLAVSRWSVTAEDRVRAWPVREGFVVDQVVLRQVFLRVLQFFRVNIIPPWLSILAYHLRDGQ